MRCNERIHRPASTFHRRVSSDARRAPQARCGTRRRRVIFRRNSLLVKHSHLGYPSQKYNRRIPDHIDVSDPSAAANSGVALLFQSPRLVAAAAGSLGRLTAVMKFVNYTATPELDRFPESERFRVFRDTHKRLIREDAEYRQKVKRFRWRIIWPNLVFTPLWLILCLLVLSAPYGNGPALALCKSKIKSKIKITSKSKGPIHLPNSTPVARVGGSCGRLRRLRFGWTGRG
jgi:hypothetical protein